MRLDQIPNFYELMEGYLKVEDGMHTKWYKEGGEIVGHIIHGTMYDSYWVKDISDNIETTQIVNQLIK